MNELKKKIGLFHGIGRKIFIWLLIFSLLPLSLSIYQGYTGTRNALKEKIFQQLDTVANYNRYNLIKFLEEREISLNSIVASNHYLFSAIRALENKSTKRGKEQVLKELLEHLSKKELEDKNGYGFSVINKRGKVLASIDSSEIGTDKSEASYFKNGKFKPLVTAYYYFSKPDIIISTPIIDNEEFLGIMTKRINPKALFSILKKQEEELGFSGRKYLVNDEYVILSGRETPNDPSKTIASENEGVMTCLNEEDGVNIYKNHKGDTVLGAYRFIPKLKWALMCEVNQKEAFAPLLRLRNQAVVFGILLFFIVIAVATYITQGITKPIRNLAVASRGIAKGELSRRVAIASFDEIGQLAEAFNQMAEELEEYYKTLEKKVEERTKELKSHQEYITNITDNSADAILSLDRNNIIRSWNSGAEQIFGYKSEEIIGRHFEILVPEDLKKKGEIEKVVSETEEKGFIKNYETERLTKDGRRLIIDLTKTAIRNSNGELIGSSAIVRDITEKKNLQRQIIQSEKLSAVGELTAGLAHEIGTPLNIISGRAEYLISMMGEDHKISRGLKIIIDQIDRITSLIQQLLKFTRSEKKEVKQININNVIRETINLLETKLDKSKIKIQTNRINDLPLIFGDENQLQQVFINLFINAIHAMPNGGEIEVSTQPIQKNHSIMIKIKDTGCGIPEENLSRIFDPFFTTKETGKGTGLGLAVTYGIIKDHGGTIEVTSRVNKGSEFVVIFPVSKG